MSQMAGYIGMLIASRFPSAREAGKYPKVSLEALLTKVTLDDLRRGADGSYARDDWEYGSDEFSTEEYGKEEPLDQRQARIMANLGMVAEQLAADRSTAALLRAIEISVASVLYDATTYSGQYNAVTNEWDDAANAVPITDVKGAIERFEARNGFSPNALVMNRKQARNVLLTSQVQTVLGYRPSVGGMGEHLQGNVAAEILAAVLGVERVLIAGGSGGAWKNTVLPGGTASLSRIWSDEYVALTTIADGTDLRSPTFMRAFVWTGDGGPGGADILLEQYHQPDIRSDVVRARTDLQLKVVHSELLEGLSNITT